MPFTEKEVNSKDWCKFLQQNEIIMQGEGEGGILKLKHVNQVSLSVHVILLGICSINPSSFTTDTALHGCIIMCTVYMCIQS